MLAQHRGPNEAIVQDILLPKLNAITNSVVMKRRHHKCPCVYYANTTATFHALLEGDLVFKLNPGPNNRVIDSIVTTHRRSQKMMSTSTRNTANLVNIRREPYIRNAIHPLSLCLMNTQSIRNKTADFVDYVCENKFDLVTVTETWLEAIDDSIRAQLCPTGYKFMDKPREGRRGRGYCSSLQRFSESDYG